MPAGDIQGELEEQVAEALLDVNPNTYSTYPPEVWDGSAELSWPITVYTVETSTVETRARAEARVRVTVRVDTFGRSRKEAGDMAAAVKEAMLGICAACDMDRAYDAPEKGIVRRAQTYRGILHTGDRTIYAN